MTVGHVEKEQDCGLKSEWGVWGTSGGLIRGTAWSAVFEEGHLGRHGQREGDP